MADKRCDIENPLMALVDLRQQRVNMATDAGEGEALDTRILLEIDLLNARLDLLRHQQTM
jgi:hypothetical protein